MVLPSGQVEGVVDGRGQIVRNLDFNRVGQRHHHIGPVCDPLERARVLNEVCRVAIFGIDCRILKDNCDLRRGRLADNGARSPAAHDEEHHDYCNEEQRSSSHGEAPFGKDEIWSHEARVCGKAYYTVRRADARVCRTAAQDLAVRWGRGAHPTTPLTVILEGCSDSQVTAKGC